MVNADQSKEKLQDILSKREYQIYYEDNRSLLEIWWENAKEWLIELFEQFFSFEPSSGFANGFLIMTIVVVAALIVLVLFFATHNSRGNRTLYNHQPLQSSNEINWSHHNHLTEARKQESIENYAIATRHLFLALLLYFHEKGWLEARIWKTNWEYFDELQKVDQQRAEDFFKLAHVFDEVVYGEQIMQKDEYLQYQAETIKWLDEAAEEKSME